MKDVHLAFISFAKHSLNASHCFVQFGPLQSYFFMQLSDAVIPSFIDDVPLLLPFNDRPFSSAVSLLLSRMKEGFAMVDEARRSEEELRKLLPEIGRAHV